MAEGKIGDFSTVGVQKSNIEKAVYDKNQDGRQRNRKEKDSGATDAQERV